ncbi:TraB/GumN family protein [Brevundimonas vesicularis]|uniref:TraB/GumN family protein n=1 Tax=Brevundimonas vesicularis TaxID=41276 RepID=A0A1Z3U9F4_BREVE|nr:TraB/GumN family protein [Brevundimonas vesicularis]ASE39885.1 TraB/GumN family protein [Brevundimonas vesicularis]MDX2335081.1 TraB/GumN family protein [Brevundimonas vesicularis]
MTFTDRLLSSVSSLARGAVGVAGGLALFVAIAGVPADALAQTAAPAAPAPIQGEGPALWVVKDADSTLYLFGSVHVLRPTTGWASPRVEAAFDSASDIWFEISNPDDQAAIMPLIQQHGLSPETPLSSRLTPEENAELDAAAKAMGAYAAQLQPMKPWLAALSLSVAPLIKAGYDPKSGVELVLKARAEAAGKPIHGFETIDKQVGILAGLPDDVQLVFLRETLKDYENAATKLDEMVEAWARGDVATLDRVTITEMKEASPALYQSVLVDRNTDWANQIQTLLEGSGTAFIAVGAAHLTGDDSVQAILQKRGVTVEAAH